MGTLPHHLLLARFRIQPDMLRERATSLLDFAWSEPLDNFIQQYSLQSMMERSRQPTLPFRRLNSAIIARVLSHCTRL